jgi:hypothetical protein
MHLMGVYITYMSHRHVFISIYLMDGVSYGACISQACMSWRLSHKRVLMVVYLMGVYLMGVRLMVVYLMGVCLMIVYLWTCIS